MIRVNLKKLRLARDISQDRLSKLANLSLNTIVKIESGRNPNPTIGTLIKISRALRVKLDDLVKVALLVILSFACFNQAKAQEGAPKPGEEKPRVITLSQGIQRVLADSRLIKIALDNEESAFQTTLISRSALLPRVGFTASQTFLSHQPAAKFGEISTYTAQKESFAYGFDVYQTLFDFGKSLSRYKASQQAVTAEKAQTESVRRMAVLEFITTYFNLLETQRMIAVFEGEVESLSSYLKDIEHLYEQGVVVKNDVLPATVRLADVKQKLIAARNAREVVAAHLNNILALPVHEKVTVEDIRMQPAEFPGWEKAWSTAQSERPELKFYQEQIQASVLLEKSKAADNLPVLFAEGGYAYSENRYQVHQDNFSGVLGAQMDLYDGGVTRARVEQERTRRKQLNEEKDKLIEDIKLEIEESYYGLKNASERTVVARDALEQAKENVRFYRVKYNAGSAIPSEVLEAIALETESQTNYYASDYALKRGYAKLMYSMGIDLALIYERMESKDNGDTAR